jgi:alcohol dehydrogenase
VVFDKILPNPIKAHVMEAADLARKEGCDFIIGLGGGAALIQPRALL